MLHLPKGLPPPSAEDIALSLQLSGLIREDIAAAGGLLSFARFMEMALYTPGLGYYAGGRRKFGEHGDFITAPECSALFSRCLARVYAAVSASLAGCDCILEFGAGSGVMAADVLAELERLGVLPDSYLILELSGDLRARQEQTLVARVPHLVERVRWLARLPSSIRGVVLANEVVDAMPVHRFVVHENDIAELCVAWEGERFVWRESLPASGPLREGVMRLQHDLGSQNFCPGYCSELNPMGPAWVQSVASTLDAGVVLVIDYGFPSREYYHPDRSQGTLMCHYHHRAHGDPLILVGLQDITAHVDFTALALAGCEAGLDVLGYTSQAHFLLESGLTEMLAASDPAQIRDHLSVTQQVKRLTLPSEMGELFKVLALGKAVPEPLLGFVKHDRRARL
jgi:SAM-dependent MidA family methyltransferase